MYIPEVRLRISDTEFPDFRPIQLTYYDSRCGTQVQPMVHRSPHTYVFSVWKNKRNQFSLRSPSRVPYRTELIPRAPNLKWRRTRTPHP